MTSDFGHFPHVDGPIYRFLDLVVRYRVMQVRQLVNFEVLEVDLVQRQATGPQGQGV